MIEIMIVLAISMLLAGIALPIMTNAMNSYRQSAAVSAATGAISATRFQAIMRGYPYEIVFTPSTMSYQVYNEPPELLALRPSLRWVQQSLCPRPVALP